PERFELLLVGALDLGRIVEPPVERVVVAREDRAGLTGAVADRDDVVEGLAEELCGRLAPGARPVDPDLREHTNGIRIDALRLHAGREGFELGATEISKHRLAELASGGVACADKQD